MLKESLQRNTTDKIIALYRDKFNLRDFYQLAGHKIKDNQLINEYYNYGSNSSGTNDLENKVVSTEIGDLRIDLPIWFGDENSCKLKIMVLGLEPRDTKNKFNIEKIGKHVFATPFALEHWTNRNKYFKSFEQLIKRTDVLSYFTDVVKEYEVKSSKNESDKFAVANFWKKAEDPINLQFLKSEVNLLKPDFIIGLGNNSYKFLRKHFGNELKIQKVIHPNARQNKITKENAWQVADKQIFEILNM